MADIIFPDEEPGGVVGATKLPSNVDIDMWKGDAQEFIVKINDELGAPIDLTGSIPAAVMRASFNSPTTYSFECTLQNTNEVRVYMSSAVSKTIPAGDYIWNLQITAPNGDVRTYLAGDVTVYAEVDG